MKYSKVCEVCEKEFYVEKKSCLNKRRFCSHACSNSGQARRQSKEHVKVVCAQCGKEEEVFPSRARKYICCSVECMGNYNSIKMQRRVEKICVICGKSYFTKKSHAQRRKLCGDKACTSTYFSLTRKGTNNSNYKLGNHLGMEQDHKRKTSEYLALVRGILEIPNLPTGYHVHHRDGDCTNNTEKNLSY